MTTKTLIRNLLLSGLVTMVASPSYRVHGDDGGDRAEAGRRQTAVDVGVRTDRADQPASADDTLRQLAKDAVFADKAAAAAAWSKLRSEGPRGLEALFAAHRQTIEAMRQGRLPLGSEMATRVRAALDSVAQQRDAFASGLFWFTDFAAAQAAARASGRPILSLRLLGRLDEEFSCANSRFFRTTLYANDEVATALRENFVLHWQSVRPAPLISVDFGDGRRIERTITGNSIHYLVDADGDVIDALPGLLGAKVFLANLREAIETVNAARPLSREDRLAFFAHKHRDALRELSARWDRDMSTLGLENRPLVPEGARLALAKENSSLNELWSRLGALHQIDSGLDRSSRSLLRAKNPSADAAAIRAVSKTVVEAPLLRALRNLETTIAQDTVRNEYLLHSQIHAWLAAAPEPPTLAALNRRIYAELFLTPDEDPWLGLAPRDTLSALENDGRLEARR